MTDAMQAEGTRWAIAAPHGPAAQAGAAAFERGGSAIDAALAAAATLSVAYPHMCGIGGDLFAVVHRPEGDTLAVNASGRSPAAADPDDVRRRHGDVMPTRGPDTVTVPGAVSGWEALHRIGGRRPWAEALTEAIRLAQDGAIVSRSLASLLDGPEGAPIVRADPGLASVFAPGGEALALGDTFRQPSLGRTLEALARGGAEALYRGRIGQAYVRGLRAAGSPISLEDLAAHEASIVPPLLGRSEAVGVHLAVAPPNSQGYALLQLLSALDRLRADPDPHGAGAGTLARIFLESLRDVRRHLADPERMTVHPSTLLDDGHMAAFCEAVSSPVGEPGPSLLRPTGDTIAIVAADADGMTVTLIQSLFHGLGSGICEPQTGIVAHDRGACFTLRPGVPNSFAPRVRPLHTLLPAIVLDDLGRASGAGTMGGFQQAQIDVQTIVHAFAGEMTPSQAVAAPRWVLDDLPGTSGLPEILIEADMTALARDALEASGLPTREIPALDERAGHAQMVRRFEGRLLAGTDPRADGAALAD